jgi:prenyltransferase beta subunit
MEKRGREPLARCIRRTAARSRRFLDRNARAEIARFILRQRMPDGGFKGRGADSDLYYTVFAAAGLKALGRPVPARGLWTYLRAFGAGEHLDPVHRCCLIRLRSAFPMCGKTRERLSNALSANSGGSAYTLFLNRLAAEDLKRPASAAEPSAFSLTDPTPVLAAAGAMSCPPQDSLVNALFSRVAAGGGFCATEQIQSADLLSTAVALFALQRLGADLNPVRRPCLTFIESLWLDSGGFSGHAADEFADVEYTFYALLGIGCLML